MLNFYQIIKDSTAYKTVKAEYERGTLSHAYFLLIPDKKYIKEYLKVFSKLVLGAKDGDRISSMIDNGAYSDLITYPKNKDTIVVDDIKALIEESYYKPTENKIKLFVIENAQNMNVPAQNKLLKTLEEPPKNVVILLGATSDFSLLQTVKSRVKKLELPPLSEEVLFKALKDDYADKNLSLAISLSDKTLGSTVDILENENVSSAIKLANDIIENMQSSAQVLDFSNKTTALKIKLKDFLPVLSWAYSSALNTGEKTGVYPNGYKTASILNALEKITEVQKRLTFNAGEQALIEWLYLQILEGRFKWQKL
jgi:DNA polymerase-3 subunit delta'